MRLKGKIAVVTGAGQGIGRGIAEVFAEEGADIVVSDINLDSRTDDVVCRIRKLGRRAIPVKADVSKRVDLEQANKLFKQAQELQKGAH